MTEVTFPLGGYDATEVDVTTSGYTYQKYRQAVHIGDPFVEGARLRLASVDGTYRLPVSTGNAYRISDDDVDSDPEYYGFVRADSYWYIMRITNSSNTYRYFAGTSAYATGWTNRASHSYGYWDAIF